MEKRNSQLEHREPMEQTRGLFCTCDSGVALSIATPVSLLANEFDVRSVLHGQVGLAAVNIIRVIHETMNSCKNLDSLKDCFENMNIIKCPRNAPGM